MANELDDAAPSGEKSGTTKRRIPDEVVQSVIALGSDFVCAARVTLTTDEEGEHKLDFKFLPELISVRQAGKALAVSPTTIQNLIKDGTLVTHRVGRATTIRWKSVWSILKAQPERN